MNVTLHTQVTPGKVLAPEDFVNPEDFVSSGLRQLWTSSSNQIAGIQHTVTYYLYAVCITCILNGMSGNSKPEGSGRHRQTGDGHTHTQDRV